MSPVRVPASPTMPDPSPAPYTDLGRLLQQADVDAALQLAADHFQDQLRFHELCEVRKLQLRRSLGMPLVSTADHAQLSESSQHALEGGLVEIFREIGLAFFQQGDVETGWSYLRFLPDRGEVLRELERVPVTEANRDGVIGLLLREGLDPEQGFRLVLQHYGTCNAITTMHHTMYGRPKLERQQVGNLLVQHVHEELLTNVRAHIERHTGSVPTSTSIAELISDRDWLLADGGYHIDTSHLSSTVQIANELVDSTVIELALDLARYGARLAPELQYAGDPPFEDLYRSHQLWFQSQMGMDPAQGVEYFRERAAATDAHRQGTYPIEIYIDLLARIGRPEDALEAHVQLIPAGIHTTGRAPSLFELSEMMQSFARLQTICQERADVLGFLLAGIQSCKSSSTT